MGQRQTSGGIADAIEPDGVFDGFLIVGESEQVLRALATRFPTQDAYDQVPPRRHDTVPHCVAQGCARHAQAVADCLPTKLVQKVCDIVHAANLVHKKCTVQPHF
jgi:hypothetical protein